MAFARCEICNKVWDWGSVKSQGKRLADITCPTCGGALKGINQYFVPGAEEIDQSYKKRIVKSRRGTWGYDIGHGRVAALTSHECVARGFRPGPGNN